jgi:hypothetical protein
LIVKILARSDLFEVKVNFGYIYYIAILSLKDSIQPNNFD